MHQQYLTIWDLVLTPIYLLVLILIARRHRDKKYPVGNPLRKYYLPGLYVKLGGAIFIALIYQYYYKGGDTFNYFNQSKIINSSLQSSFSTWMKLLVQISPDADPKLYAYTSQIEFYNDPASFMVIRFGALLGLLNFTTYIPIALLFAFFSYSGIWAMYKTFAQVYPNLIRPLAIAFLFIPSTFVWGSAMFKDTICMFGLGWMVYATFRIFNHRDFSVKNIFLIGLSFYLLAVVKVYILLSFLPALSLWVLLRYSHKITSLGIRVLVRMIFIAFTIGGFVFFANRFSKELNKYSLDKIAQTAASTRGWITTASDVEGSSYDLGNFEPTLQGMLTKFPAGVVVTLFRPFFWEAKKVIVLLSALEAIIFLIGTFMVIRKNGIPKFARRIAKDPNLSFFLVFSLIFAFAVGVSSYNFGALSRYKIPCLPFYAAFLIILYYDDKKPVKELARKKNSAGEVTLPPVLEHQ
jgi:hypothetical protein